MKTLSPDILAASLAVATRPRLFVGVPGAGLYYGTAILAVGGNTYTDHISTRGIGSIETNIAPAGGMGSVSGASVDNLVASDEFGLATEVTVAPTPEGSFAGAGRVTCNSITQNRDALYGDLNTAYLTIGQRPESIAGLREVHRGFLQFTVPAGLISCEDACIVLSAHYDGSETDFELVVVEGTWSVLKSSGLFNDFSGWQASGIYPITRLNEPNDSGQMPVAGEQLYIRLNRAGRDYVASCAGGLCRLMILSMWDIADRIPGDNEFVTFLAQGTTVMLRYNTRPLINQVATIYLGYQIGSTAPTLDLPIWTGVVDRFAIGPMALSLDMRQNDHKKNVMIPRRIITREEFPDAADDQIGKPFPVVYGDFTAGELKHRNGIGRFQGAVGSAFTGYDFGYTDNMITALVIKKTHPYQALLSELPMMISQRPFYMWNSSRELFELFCYEPTTLSPSQSEVIKELRYNSIDSFPDELVTIMSIGATQQTVKPSGSEDFGTEDSANVYDDIDSTMLLPSSETYAIFYFDDPDGVSIDTKFGRWNISFKLAITADYVHVNWQYTTDGGETWVEWRDGNYQNFSASGWCTLSDPETFVTASGIPISSFSSMRLIIRKFGNGSATVDHLCVVASNPHEEFGALATLGQGMPFPSWIDESSRSNSYSAGQLIENPAAVIESVARDLGGYTSAEIDTAAFDRALVDLAGWKFAFQAIERWELKRYLDALGIQCRARVRHDHYDRLTITVFDDDEYFPVSGSRYPAGLDIIATDPETVDGRSTRHAIVGTDMLLRPIDIDDVRNDFVVRYRINNSSGEYTRVLYMTNGQGDAGAVDTNINPSYLSYSRTVPTANAAGLSELKRRCAQSYTEIETTNTLELEAWAIRDERTATRLLQHLIEWHTALRYQAQCTVHWSLIAHDVGDVVNIRFPRIYQMFGAPATEVKRWLITDKRDDFEAQECRITAVELYHD